MHMNTGEGPLKDITYLGSRAALATPFAGMHLRMYGCSTVEADNMKKLMKEGKNLGLVPGGFEEATITV